MTYIKDKILYLLEDKELETKLKTDYLILKEAEFVDDCSLIILNLNRSSFDLMEKINPHYQIPVMMIDDFDEYLVKRAYAYGVNEFCNKNISLAELKIKIQYLINNYKQIINHKQVYHKLIINKQKLNNMLANMMLEMFKYHQKDSARHMNRIRMITYILLKEIQKDKPYINDVYIENISYGATFHDIGKIGINDNLINSESNLRLEDYIEVKKHTLIGFKILYDLQDRFDNELIYEWALIARWHHERIDGQGYPDGLKGDEIPLFVQVVSLADAYDALNSARSYKKALKSDEAIKMIKQGECGQFNPYLLQVLTRCENKLNSLD